MPVQDPALCLHPVVQEEPRGVVILHNQDVHHVTIKRGGMLCEHANSLPMLLLRRMACERQEGTRHWQRVAERFRVL